MRPAASAASQAKRRRLRPRIGHDPRDLVLQASLRGIGRDFATKAGNLNLLIRLPAWGTR